MKKTLRRIRHFLAMFLGLTLLTGCWDQRPIEQRAIVVAIGVSAHDRWTFLFPNVAVTASSLSSLGETKQFYAIEVHAPSYTVALHRVQLQSSRQVSMGDLEVIDVSSDLTGSQLSRIVDAMTLSGSVPSQVWLTASQTSPSMLVMQHPPQTIVPVYYLSSYFSCHGCHAAGYGVRAWEWWDQWETPGVSPILPMFTPTAQGAAVRQMLVYGGHGAPRLMPRTVTEGYAYLTGKVHSGTLRILVDGQPFVITPIVGQASSQVRLTPTTVDVRVTLHAQGEMQMADMRPGIILTPAIERAVDQAAGRRLVQLSLAAIDWANHTHTDPFGYAKRAAWFQTAVAQSIPPQQLVTLPIDAQVMAQVVVQGEGLVR